jgi:hypothetical protein
MELGYQLLLFVLIGLFVFVFGPFRTYFASFYSAFFSRYKTTYSDRPEKIGLLNIRTLKF